MAKTAPTVKIGPEIDRKLYAEFCKIAEQNGQTQRFLLEKAIRHYIEFTFPSQKTIRPEVMAHFHRSTAKNRELLRRLAR